MNSDQSLLGTCPFCRASVPENGRRVVYEKNGRTTTYVECPGCREVVQPE